MLRCCQVALSSLDLARSHWWYQRALGFIATGERRYREGAEYAAVPGLPEAAFHVDCLVGRHGLFQIEMFEFVKPRARARASDWRLCDIGYGAIGIHVKHFDEALARIDIVGGVLNTTPIGDIGRRRVCLRDPDGTLLEIMEDDILAGGPEFELCDPDGPAVRSVTLSVRNVDRVREFWVDVLGCQESGVRVHTAAHERLWGLEGAARNALVLVAGTVVIEFVEYTSKVGRARPAGYMISDQGILNVAFGSTDRREFDAVYARAVASGFEPPAPPWSVPGVATVVYLTDLQGFSVELLHVEADALDRMGFVPKCDLSAPAPRSVTRAPNL